MARLPRLVVAGLPHHVIQRGNSGRAVFLDDADRAAYRQWLRTLAPAHGVAIHAYVLMPGHIQLLATPAEASGLGRFMQALGRQYVRGFNRRHGFSGGLWEGRFRSTVLEPGRYLLPCMQYLESIPVQAGLVGEPGHYPWSSYGHHSGTAMDLTVSDHSVFWSLGNTPFDRQLAYRRRFENPISTEDLAAIQDATQHGWALGDKGFLAQLVKHGTRRPTALRRGRPARRSGS